MPFTRHAATRTRTTAASLLIGFFVAGCHDANIPAEPGSITPPLSAKGGIPGPPDGGGSGDSEQFVLTLTEGLVGGPMLVTPDRDNNKALRISLTAGPWQWNMINTNAAAVQEITNPDAAAVCQFDPADMNAALKQQAAALLLQVPIVDGAFHVAKKDGFGSVGFRTDDQWSSYGFNSGGAAMVTDNGSGVDWNDKSSTRQFRFAGGNVRVVVKIDTTVNPRVMGDMVCAAQDEVLAELAPAP
jgi:hypothetical protein